MKKVALTSWCDLRTHFLLTTDITKNEDDFLNIIWFTCLLQSFLSVLVHWHPPTHRSFRIASYVIVNIYLDKTNLRCIFCCEICYWIHKIEHTKGERRINNGKSVRNFERNTVANYRDPIKRLLPSAPHSRFTHPIYVDMHHDAVKSTAINFPLFSSSDR